MPFLRRLARALITLEPLLLALLLPVVLVITPRASPLLLLIPLLWLARRLALGRFLPPSPLNGALLLLLLMVLVSLWATFDLALSLPSVAALLYGLALYAAAVSFANRSPRHFRWALAAYLALGLAVAALALFTTQWKSEIPFLPALLRRLPASRNTVNPNYLAGALLWIAPLPLALTAALPTLARALRRRAGPLAALALTIFLITSSLFFAVLLLFSQSRSGLLGLAAALGLVVLVSLRRRRRLLGALLMVLALAAVALAVALPSTFWMQLAGVSNGAANPATGGAAGTLGLGGRLEIWQRALYAVQDFPFTGLGMGAFEPVVHVLYPLFTISPTTSFGHAHNHLLQVAVDLGLPGLIAYLALWFLAAAMLLDAWRNASAPWHRPLLLGFAAALLGYFVWGLAEAIPLGGRPAFIFWFLLALITSLHHHTVPVGPNS